MIVDAVRILECGEFPLACSIDYYGGEVYIVVNELAVCVEEAQGRLLIKYTLEYVSNRNSKTKSLRFTLRLQICSLKMLKF